MKTGALHTSPARQLMTPLPYSPPTMKAAFFSSGMTATQRARVQYSCGIEPRMSCTIAAAFASRSASVEEIAAPALAAPKSTAAPAHTNLCINHLDLDLA